MKEEFRPIPYKPFGERYSVSNFGNVRVDIKSKYSNNKTDFLRPGVGARGYSCYTFYHNGKKKQCFVHRMVLLAFTGEPPEGRGLALHLDDNKKNNHLDNLRWGSSQDNMTLMVQHNRQTKGAKVNTAKLDESQVIEIRNQYQKGNHSQTELAAAFGVNQTQISRIVLRKSWRWL